MPKRSLIFVTDREPGFSRRRRANGFQYLDPAGRIIRNPRELERITALAVPPAYKDVWICRHARGHLQATGRDARGRKQYRYHASWRLARDTRKFDRLITFGRALPTLRRKLQRDLARPGLPRDKVLALMISVLDATRVRIGNPAYARDNQSFGLATLRDRHAHFKSRGHVLLDFRGKGGKQHEIQIDNPRLAGIMRRCQELPGQHLFQYVGDDDRRYAMHSQDVNQYLHDTMGADVTSKDFRTWAGTVRAIALLARIPLPVAPNERFCKSQINKVVSQVALELRNTPAVCRKSYINPVVFEAWRSGLLQQKLRDRLSGASPAKTEKLIHAFMRRHLGGTARRSPVIVNQ